MKRLTVFTMAAVAWAILGLAVYGAIRIAVLVWGVGI